MTEDKLNIIADTAKHHLGYIQLGDRQSILSLQMIWDYNQPPYSEMPIEEIQDYMMQAHDLEIEDMESGDYEISGLYKNIVKYLKVFEPDEERRQDHIDDIEILE